MKDVVRVNDRLILQTRDQFGKLQGSVTTAFDEEEPPEYAALREQLQKAQARRLKGRK